MYINIQRYYDVKYVDLTILNIALYNPQVGIIFMSYLLNPFSENQSTHVFFLFLFLLYEIFFNISDMITNELEPSIHLSTSQPHPLLPGHYPSRRFHPSGLHYQVAPGGPVGHVYLQRSTKNTQTEICKRNSEKGASNHTEFKKTWQLSKSLSLRSKFPNIHFQNPPE